MLFPLSFFLFQLVVSEIVGFSLLFIFSDGFSFFTQVGGKQSLEFHVQQLTKNGLFRAFFLF